MEEASIQSLPIDMPLASVPLATAQLKPIEVGVKLPFAAS